MPCQIDDIPIVDAVVISHNHYDHLDRASVATLASQAGGVPLFLVPLGLKSWLEQLGITRAIELDWWEERDLTLKPEAGSEVTTKDETASKADTIQARIGCLPCQHTSARSPLDKAHTLWSSWSVECGGQKVWFAG